MNVKNLSFSSRAITDNPYSLAYELEDYGFKGWELVQEGNQYLNKKNVEYVKNIYETTNLEISLHLPFSDMNLASINQEIRKVVIRQIKHCLRLASPFVELAVLHPGYLSPYGSQVPELAESLNIESIQTICDYAAKYDILIALENMPNIPKIFGTKPTELLNIVELVDRKNLGLTFDAGHANTFNAINEFLIAYKNKISHVHIHDNFGKKDLHMQIGTGTIDWVELMNGLSNYKGLFVIEANTLEDGIKGVEFLNGI